jgi:hypothetical protein
MKLALILFSILTSTSLWFAGQQKPPIICRGKPLSITLLPGPKMTWDLFVPLRFGGTRELTRPPITGFPSEKGFREVIRNREEFIDFWRRLHGRVPPGGYVMPLPEIDFSKEMIVVAAMGQRPSSGYAILIDGACDVDGQIEVFVSSVEDVSGIGVFPAITAPADAVRLPRSDLPVVFRETQLSSKEWRDRFKPVVRDNR